MTSGPVYQNWPPHSCQSKDRWCVVYDLLPSHTFRNECGPLKKTKHNRGTSSIFQAYRLGQLSQPSGQKSEF